MSLCVIVCLGCGQEITSTDDMYRTPRGQLVCGDCVRENCIDVALSW